MVGQPKSLTDLRKIDANLRVTCQACGNVREIGREQLIRDLVKRNRSLAWSMLPQAMRCSCGSKDVRLIIIPFGEQDHPPPPELKRFLVAAEAMLAAERQGRENVDSLVRLSAATLEYHQAKRALIAWAMLG